MEVRIQSIHFDASEKLEAFIQKKAEKLEKFCDDIKKVEVSLKVVKPETAMNKEAGVRILALNSEFYAEKVCNCRKQKKNSKLNKKIRVFIL